MFLFEFQVVFLCVAVAAASASHVGLWDGGHWNPAAHIASGSVSVGANGAVVAGPSGSVRTDNGLHGGGAGAVVSGAAGDVRTHGGAVALAGPGLGAHGAGWGVGLGAHGIGWGRGLVGAGWGLGGWGHGGLGLGGWGHGGVWGHGW